MEMDFEKLLQLPLIAMKLIAVHPETSRNLKWFLHFFVLYSSFTIVFLFLIYNILFHNIRNDDYSHACRNGLLALTYLAVTFKIYILFRRRNLLMNLMEIMERDLKLSKSLHHDELTIVSTYAKKGNFVCKLWLAICIYACSIFSIKAYLSMTYYYVIGEFKLVHIYDLNYPSAIEEKKDTWIVYSLAYIAMFYYGVYAGIMYVAFVPMGPVLMLHACGRLELVKRRVDYLFPGEDLEVNEKLKDIVIHLQYTYSFVADIKECFKGFYEMTLKVSTLTLPVTSYELMESLYRGAPGFEFALFIISAIISSSFPCYYGDLLIEKGEEVRLAVYSCGWESRYDWRMRTTLTLVLLRAQVPVAIRTLFRTVGLDALTDLFQQSYAIFNFMNAVWN